MSATRREFLKRSLTCGAVAAFARGVDAAPETARVEGRLPRRILGRTKESVTILGLGCAYAGAFTSERTTRAILEAAIEGGVRYFDAAPEYERAEERLAPVIKPMRDQVFLVTKTYERDAKGAEKDLATALGQLQTDHVDLFLQHAVGVKPISTNAEILGKGGSLEFLRKAKERGLTRFIGLSVHAPHAAALRLLDESDAWDVAMPFVNYVDRAQRKADGETENLLARARRGNVGVVAMKVMGGWPGKMADDYDRAFRYALSIPGVACALVGVRSVEEVERALRAARRFRPMTQAEMQETIRKGEEAVRAKSKTSAILYRHRERDFGSACTV